MEVARLVGKLCMLDVLVVGHAMDVNEAISHYVSLNSAKT